MYLKKKIDLFKNKKQMYLKIKKTDVFKNKKQMYFKMKIDLFKKKQM